MRPRGDQGRGSGLEQGRGRPRGGAGGGASPRAWEAQLPCCGGRGAGRGGGRAPPPEDWLPRRLGPGSGGSAGGLGGFTRDPGRGQRRRRPLAGHSDPCAPKRETRPGGLNKEDRVRTEAVGPAAGLRPERRLAPGDVGHEGHQPRSGQTRKGVNLWEGAGCPGI